MIIQLDGERITVYDDQTTDQSCPKCGATLKASVEPNHASGISLTCPTPYKECAYSRFVYYTQMYNFQEVVADRIIDNVDFNEVHYSRYKRELSSDYLLTPDGLWRAWGYPRRFQEVPISELPDVDPVDIAVRRHLDWHDSWGSAFEEYFDAFPGPYWTLSERLQRDHWHQVSDLFARAENDNGRYQWYTRSPREVTRRLIDTVWDEPSEEDIQTEARRQAKDEAVKQHREQIQEQYERWLSEQQKNYETWVKETLNGLVRTTVYPRPDDEHIVWRKHWHEDLDGTWYTTGGSYIGVQHPQDGEYIVHYYGNASAAYATEEQANRWYEQKWEETKRTPEIALDLLTTWLEGGHVYGGDFAMWVCEHCQEDVLALARSGEVVAQYGAAYGYALASKFYQIPIRVVRKTSDKEYYGYGDPQNSEGPTAWVEFGEEGDADWPTEADIAAEKEDSAKASARFSALFT